MRVYLVGFMASGKTTVGRMLAGLFEPRWDFVDLDSEIERLAGKTIPEIFASEGEAGFRQRESAALERISGQHAQGAVVATGGGIVSSEDNIDLLRRTGTVVWLDVPFEVAVERHLASSIPRPILDDVDAASRVYESRLPLYQAAADLRAPGFTSELVTGPEEIARDVWLRVKKVTELEPVNVLDSYEVTVRPGIIDDCGDAILLAADKRSLHARGQSRKALVVSENDVASLYLGRLQDSLRRSGFEPVAFEHPGGEGAKSLDVTMELYDFMADEGLGRDTFVVALGGGVTGDLAGFASATYMRGTPFVQVPTTLLAQIDASVGGKAAVNHPRGKNLIGAFHQPITCVHDPLVLRSLPDSVYKEGLAEAVKCAVIEGDDFLDWLEANAPRIWKRDVFVLSDLVRRCCSIKARIVGMDERDHGPRQWLNLGHTFAHALENAFEYSGPTHGLCVAVGLVWACVLSETAGLLADPDLSGRIKRLLLEFGLPSELGSLLGRSPGEEAKAAIMEAMTLDKKARGGKTRFVLPRRAGSLEITEDISREDLLTALSKIDECSGGKD